MSICLVSPHSSLPQTFNLRFLLFFFTPDESAKIVYFFYPFHETTFEDIDDTGYYLKKSILCFLHTYFYFYLRSQDLKFIYYNVKFSTVVSVSNVNMVKLDNIFYHNIKNKIITSFIWFMFRVQVLLVFKANFCKSFLFFFNINNTYIHKRRPMIIMTRVNC